MTEPGFKKNVFRAFPSFLKKLVQNSPGWLFYERDVPRWLHIMLSHADNRVNRRVDRAPGTSGRIWASLGKFGWGSRRLISRRDNAASALPPDTPRDRRDYRIDTTEVWCCVAVQAATAVKAQVQESMVVKSGGGQDLTPLRSEFGEM